MFKIFKIITITILLFTSSLFSKELEKVSLQLQWLDQFQFAGYYVAKEKGFYENVGLDVELKKYDYGIFTVDEVVNEKATYGVGRSTLIIDKSKGADIKLLAAVFQSSPSIMIATKESNINSIKDFAGRSMMATEDVSESISLLAIAKREGVDIESVKFIKHSFNVDDLINKKTDLMASYISNEPFSLKQKGVEINIFNPADYGFDFYGDILFTSDTEIKNHKQRAMNFTKASLKGWEYAFSHIEETVELIYEKYNSQNKSKEALRYEGNELKKLAYAGTKEIGKLEVTNVQRIYDIYNIFGYIKSSINFDKFIVKSTDDEVVKFTKEEQDYINNNKTIRFTGDPNWLPFEAFDENGKYIGIVSKHLKYIEKTIDINFQKIVSKDWTNALKIAINGDVDVISGDAADDILNRNFKPIETYIKNPIVIMMKDSDRFINNLEDIKDKKIAIIKDYGYTADLYKTYPNIKYIEVENIQEALLGVETGKHDVALASLATSSYFISEMGLQDIRIVGKTKVIMNVTLFINKDKPLLHSILNKTMKSMSLKDRQKIFSDWTNKQNDELINYDLLIKSIFVFVLILMFFLYRQYILGKNNKKLEKNKVELEKASLDLQKAQSIAKIGSWRYEIDKDVLIWTDEIYEIFQIDKTKHPVKKLDDFFSKVDPIYIEVVNQTYTKHLNDGKPYEITHELLLEDGTSKWIYEKCETTYDNNGKPIESNGILQDVTEKEILNKELISSHDMLEKLSKNVPGAIYQYRLYPDGKTSFPYISDGISELYEVQPKDLMADANAAFGIFNPDDLNSIMSSVQESAKTMNDWNIQYRVNLPKKGLRWIEGFSKPEKLEDDSILWHGYIHDITDRKNTEYELEEQKDTLYYQAHHDALTGLPNRTLFQDRLEQAIEKAKRNKSKIALLFIDLDHFKEINDSLGHDIGDEILKTVTARLKTAKRDEDTLARLGGDEFTIVLEDLHQTQDASSVSNKILESLSQPININDNVLYVSSSIGVSIYPDDGESAQNLLKYADSAMYKAKGEGRNNFQYYNSALTELAFERVVMETSLRTGLKNNEFTVHYQPQVDGTTDTIIGLEALVRWNHPTMGLVSPAKFIPLAESTGIIVELDRYVMKTAMTQMSEWYAQGLNPGILAMNLTVKQLHQKDFVEMFEDLINKTKCKANWLALEVTEGQIMNNPEEAIVVLQAISDLGIELAVDDFGTGYSSLAYLKRLPIDKLKIDQAFVRDLPGDEEDEGITKAVIALAKSLNLKVIAEGVETKQQKDFIVENGCENIQGYFYSKPIPANEFENILKNGF